MGIIRYSDFAPSFPPLTCNIPPSPPNLVTTMSCTWEFHIFLVWNLLGWAFFALHPQCSLPFTIFHHFNHSSFFFFVSAAAQGCVVFPCALFHSLSGGCHCSHNFSSIPPSRAFNTFIFSLFESFSLFQRVLLLLLSSQRKKHVNDDDD